MRERKVLRVLHVVSILADFIMQTAKKKFARYAADSLSHANTDRIKTIQKGTDSVPLPFL